MLDVMHNDFGNTIGDLFIDIQYSETHKGEIFGSFPIN